MNKKEENHNLLQTVKIVVLAGCVVGAILTRTPPQRKLGDCLLVVNEVAPGTITQS